MSDFNTDTLFKTRSPVLIVQNFVNSVVGLVGIFFLTRYYDASWGILAFGIGFVGVLSLVTDLGVSTAYVKFISGGEDEGEANTNFLVIKLVLGIIFVVLTISALEFWTKVLHQGFQTPSEYWVALSLIPYYLFVSLGSFSQSYFKYRLHSAKYAIPLIVDAVVRNSIFIVMGLLAALGIAVLANGTAAIMMAVGFDISYCIYFLLSYMLGRPWTFGKVDWTIIKRYLALALPLSLSAAVSTINSNVDKVIIQYNWQDIATGAFYLAQRLALVLSSLGSALTFFFLPILSKLHAQADSEGVNKQANEFQRLVIIFILPFVVITFFLSYYIMRIFNASLAVGTYPMILSTLALSSLFTVLMVPPSSVLISRGMSRPVGLFTVISLVVNIGLNLILIPKSVFGITFLSLGPVGGGVSSLIASFFLYIALIAVVTRRTGVRFERKTYYPLAAGAVEAIFLYLLTMFVNVQRIFFLVPTIAASAAIFGAVLLITKQIEWKDIVSFTRSLINPFHMTERLKLEKEE